MGILFEEHAKLEWRAPAIDGRVCRIWREIVLNTPRAWVYLEISDGEPPRIQPRLRELREWLNRSGSAPLYIRVNRKWAHSAHPVDYALYDLLGCYHTRIASLRLPSGDPSFFSKRDFPCLQLLDIDRSFSMHDFLRPVRWGSMLELRSLRLAAVKSVLLQWSELTQLEVLALYSARITSLPQHSQSLTTLMLTYVSFRDVTPGPMALPSLTYLSLYGVLGLKPYINAPCLVTFHDGGSSPSESFSSPVPSLVEYGVDHWAIDEPNQTNWHHSFPNLVRLIIRTGSRVLISFLRSLSGDPHSLPALQMITAGRPNPSSVLQMITAGDRWPSFTGEERLIMKGLVQVRREVCQIDLILHFETEPLFELPYRFGKVSDYPSSNCECLMRILAPETPFLKR